MTRRARRNGFHFAALGLGDRPRLGDRHAHRPKQFSDSEELERAVKRELARLEGLQAALFAEGARSLLVVL